MTTTKRALTKLTRWNQVYEYELWVMDHRAGVDIVLGRDFMIPAGVRLDLFHATARLPDEVEIPLIKTQLARLSANAATSDLLNSCVMGPEDGIIDSEGCRVSARSSMADTSHEYLGSPSHVPGALTSIAVASPRGPTEDAGIYKRWLAAQPSAVERVPYTTPTKILRRPSEFAEGSESDRDDQAECATATTEPSTEMGAESTHQAEPIPKLTAHFDRVSEASKETQLKLEGAYLTATIVSEDWGDRDAVSASEHPGNDIEFEDYARDVEQQDRVVKVLKSHVRIMISSGNDLPPPAYGVVCDIDDQEHPPIKQKTRRIPLRHLKQPFELLKGLLIAGLIAFSDSPWASPIVIALKKTGVDIRLCIDYKLEDSVTSIVEYAMPLVDDLLTDMEKYLWYCSLDAASGFWAAMMTQRARKIAAFVCALGHFEWLRMPFRLKNAPMIYPRMTDNALWGFVQPRGGWSAFAERVRTAEAADTADGGSPTDTVTHSRTRFEADRESSDLPDSLSAVVSDPRGDMFASGEAGQSSLVPVFERRSFVDDICFGGESFDSCLETLDRLLSRFEECRISVSFTKSMFVQPTVDILSHAVSREGLRADAKKLKEVLALLLLLKTGYTQLAGRTINAYTRFSTLGWINTSKTLFGRPIQFAVMLSPWHLVVHRVNEDDSAFAQLLHSTITNFVGLDKALQRVAPPSKRAMMVRMDPALPYARLPNDHRGFVLSFDCSAKTPKHGWYGSCAWILWRLPHWKIEVAASAYLESKAEYMGMNEGLRAAQAYGVTDLVVVGDSRLAIQQSLEYNASTDSLAGETLVAKEAKTTLTEASKSKLEQLNRIHEVVYKRPNREVTQVSTLRTLSGDTGTQRDNCFDFALKPRFVTAITRQQTQTDKKRVRFADTHDEDSEALPVEPEPPERPNDATTESSHVENGEISWGSRTSA
ncbi:unnamed protein product [Phytophthora fragariaefolia]|uniref:Unnamed protein product n=1 Tax=Phytophthora fragariaefolia TaxID=1490495 RepID=A0A9W6UCI0_9STRA|nr:unnamed protein product [Phytophthora fragariaefolia]